MKNFNITKYVEELTQAHLYKQEGNIIWVCTEETPFWIRKHIYHIRPMVLVMGLLMLFAGVVFPFTFSYWKELQIGVIASIMLYMRLCSVSKLPDWNPLLEAIKQYAVKSGLYSSLDNGMLYFFIGRYDELKTDLFKIGQEAILRDVNVAQNSDIPVIMHRVACEEMIKYYFVYNLDKAKYQLIAIKTKEFDRWQRMDLIRSGYPMGKI